MIISPSGIPNHFPFGMLMPNRSENSGQYRYGFNGMEKDDETKGQGNSYDFGSRIYDPRVGRWLSLDPLIKRYPDVSAYSFVSNSPILFVDPNGKEVIAYGKSAQGLVLKVMAYAFGENSGFSFNEKTNSLVHNGKIPEGLSTQQQLLFKYFNETLVQSQTVTYVKTNINIQSKVRADGTFMDFTNMGIVEDGIASTFYSPGSYYDNQNGVVTVVDPQIDIIVTPGAMQNGGSLETYGGVTEFSTAHMALHEFAHAMVNVILNEMGGEFNGVNFKDMSPIEQKDWAIQYTNTLLESISEKNGEKSDKVKEKKQETGGGQHGRDKKSMARPDKKPVPLKK
jgi:RHS repeat-associated protein